MLPSEIYVVSAKDLEKMKQDWKAEVKEEIRAERHEPKMPRRIMDEYKSEFEAFNWDKYLPWLKTAETKKVDYQIRAAISTLIRAALKEDMMLYIPDEKEPVVRRMIEGILKIMKEARNEA